MPLGKLGGLMPLGRELSKAGMFTPCGMLGNLGVPGITAGISRWRRCPEQVVDEMQGRWRSEGGERVRGGEM